jgi:hypothetical protein
MPLGEDDYISACLLEWALCWLARLSLLPLTTSSLLLQQFSLSLPLRLALHGVNPVPFVLTHPYPILNPHIGWMATVWVYPAEILPLRIRSKGAALAAAADFLGNFLVSANSYAHIFLAT